jgi:putative nucleotidyltransferase with HDIG domain
MPDLPAAARDPVALKQRIVNATAGLPLLPSSVMRLRTVLDDPRSNAEAVEAVVRPDAALTGNLLRMANSAFFGVPRHIESVRQAITLLGMRRVYEAAVGASFLCLIPERLLGYGLEAGAFWRHCVAVAVLGERLAVGCGKSPPPLAFTAGLLHDIGKLAVAPFLAEVEGEVRSRLRAGGGSLLEAERELLGVTHAEVGSALADRWQLPTAICRAVRWHHDPGASGDVGERLLVDLVHLANDLAHLLGFGVDAGELCREVDGAAAARLGLRIRQVEAVVAQSTQQIEQLADLFATVSAPKPRTGGRP